MLHSLTPTAYKKIVNQIAPNKSKNLQNVEKLTMECLLKGPISHVIVNKKSWAFTYEVIAQRQTVSILDAVKCAQVFILCEHSSQ